MEKLLTSTELSRTQTQNSSGNNLLDKLKDTALANPITLVLGFDFGTKRIGVAVGNCLTHTAQPLKILDAHEGQPDWAKVAALIQEWKAQALVVGMPYTADLTETAHILKVRKFKKRLQGRFGLPVFEVDEFQTSLESEKFIKGSKESKKKSLDAISAAIILERWLLAQQNIHLK